MDATVAARLLLPCAGLALGLVGLLWPIVRLWRSTGVFALTTTRTRSLVERVMHLGLLALVVACGGFAVLYAAVGPEPLHLPKPGVASVLVGGVLLVSGGIVVVIAQAQMGRSWRIGIDRATTALVTHGLYRWVRSPIYSGLLTTLLGIVVIARAWSVVAGWLTCVALIALQARREEAHLAHLHPEAFATWAASTGRFFPGLGRLRR